MLKRALDLIEQTAIHAVSLVVKDDNEAAVRCYEAAGFRRYEDTQDMPGFSD